MRVQAGVAIPQAVQELITNLTLAPNSQLVKMVKTPFVRRMIVRETEKYMYARLRETRLNPDAQPSVEDDRTIMGLAIIEAFSRVLTRGALSDAYLRGMLQTLIKTLFIDRGDPQAKVKFQEAFGRAAPSFLLLAPGKACNLRCAGCYADADGQRPCLEWSLVDRMIGEAKELWGERFFVISGGEPYAYRSEGQGMMELFQKHQDSFFLVYTNGTLVTDEVSRRLAESGNVLNCLSLEGFRERTDARRGAGVYDRVLATMDRLARDKVPFGVSLTAARDNVEEILSDEFVDLVIGKGALLAFLFQYMPIGRAFSLELMPTPQQRAWMWRRSWEIIREKRFFMPDFWNHGTCVEGCISAGGHGNGGYFYVDWSGAITPCVFMPYSPVNIRDVYARGQTLNDIWQEPFFQAVRQWQYDYMQAGRSTLAPCPSRDHHDELERLLLQFEPEPTDANAVEALLDPAYTEGLLAYSRAFAALTDPIWEERYVRRQAGPDDPIAPLPEPALEGQAGK